MLHCAEKKKQNYPKIAILLLRDDVILDIRYFEVRSFKMSMNTDIQYSFLRGENTQKLEPRWPKSLSAKI